MSKKIDKKNSQCISEQFMFTHKFSDEKAFFVACVKKIKNSHVNKNVRAPKFVFYRDHKKCLFLTKLDE
jgi:hypothetical protein